MFIDFQSISNARDLGGIKAADGRRVKSGVLLRTAELDEASDNDIAVLAEKYSLRHIVDFRDRSEVERKPDRKVPGARHVAVPILPDLPYKSRAFDLTPQEVFEQFIVMYRIMAGHEFCIRAWAQFFGLLLEAKGEAVLWHCVQGKDRTGIAAILLLRALGASMDDAMEDYYLTNVSLGREYEQLVSQGRGERELAIMKIVLQVFPQCLDEFFGRVNEQYGSVDGYLKNALGIGERELELLREWYTE